MRLIDADKFEAYSANGTDLEGEEFLAYLSGMQRVLEDIDDAPTIDPESLRSRWISVTERMPETWEPVLAYCKYGTREGGYVCCAFYVAPGTYEEDSDFSWDYEVLGDYNEEKDSYEIPAGWYERIHNWDDYGSVGIYSNVTHWMPLPEPPEVSDH